MAEAKALHVDRVGAGGRISGGSTAQLLTVATQRVVQILQASSRGGGGFGGGGLGREIIGDGGLGVEASHNTPAEYKQQHIHKRAWNASTYIHIESHPCTPIPTATVGLISLLTDVIDVLTVVIPSAGTLRAGVQCALASHTSKIAHEDGQCNAGSEKGICIIIRIGISKGLSSPCRGREAKLTAHDPGIGQTVVFPGVAADSAPLAIDVDLEPARHCIGADETDIDNLG